MQVGLISDIHGNAKALDAVWRALGPLAESTVLNAGDNAGYGNAPEPCCRFLREHSNIVCVQGNYDKHVAQFPEQDAEFKRKWGRSRPEKYTAIARDSGLISEASRAWLRTLPQEANLTLAGTSIILTHYSPGSKEGLGTWTPDSRLRELAARTDAKVVVCGHTHTPFAREAGGVLFVNPGSVGRGWTVCYAVLTLTPDAPPRAELKRL